MFFQFLPFLYKSLVILAKALFCSVLNLIIYYMFELCVVYLFETSLLGSTRLTCCLCLLRPALRPGSTGQWVSRVVLSKHAVYSRAQTEQGRGVTKEIRYIE